MMFLLHVFLDWFDVSFSYSVSPAAWSKNTENQSKADIHFNAAFSCTDLFSPFRAQASCQLSCAVSKWPSSLLFDLAGLLRCWPLLPSTKCLPGYRTLQRTHADSFEVMNQCAWFRSFCEAKQEDLLNYCMCMLWCIQNTFSLHWKKLSWNSTAPLCCMIYMHCHKRCARKPVKFPLKLFHMHAHVQRPDW
jgi:hypothetical protein